MDNFIIFATVFNLLALIVIMFCLGDIRKDLNTINGVIDNLITLDTNNTRNIKDRIMSTEANVRADIHLLGKRLTDTNEKQPEINYICDRRKCDTCTSEFGQCEYTTDINHAYNFKKNSSGVFVEG